MGNRSQILQALITALLVAIVSQPIVIGFKFIEDLILKSLTQQQASSLLPIISWIFLPLVFFIFFILIFISLQLGSKSYPIQNVNRPVGHEFKKWQRRLGIPLFWSQLRLTVLSGIVVIALVIFHAIRTKFGVEHGFLIFIITTDIFLQFYVSTGDIRNSLNRSISQLIISLVRQIEITLKEALGDIDIRLRLRVLIYNPRSDIFTTVYHYNMEGEPDINLGIGIKQGVVGRVFKDGRPWMLFPYRPEDLGFSKDQIDQMPTSIKWKMGLPLLCNHHPFGVLAIDCDKVIDKVWLDKILDFAHAIAISISVLLGQFPSSEMQKAFLQNR